MEQTASANEVWLSPQGYVEVRLVGNQTYQTIEAVGKACRPFIDRLNYDHKPLLGLVDFTEHKGFNAGSNKAVLAVLEDLPYQRVAMYGTSPIHREVAKALIAAMGKGKNTQMFSTKEESVAWLMMKDPVYGYES